MKNDFNILSALFISHVVTHLSITHLHYGIIYYVPIEKQMFLVSSTSRLVIRNELELFGFF